MKSLLTLVALAALPRLTQAQLPAPLYSIPLEPQETLGGAIRLANHNTLLFMSSGMMPEVRVFAIRPDGQVTWEKKLSKLQQVHRDKHLFESAEATQKRAEAASQLQPLNMYSCGNELYAVEVVDEEVARLQKKKDKTTSLKAHQRLVQCLTEQGEQKKTTFDEPIRPKKVLHTTLGRFGEQGAYYEISEEYSTRHKSSAYVLERFDMSTSKVERTTLTLPETPERGMYNRYYNRWVYLGHRANQSYFVRRLASHSKRENPIGKPMDFEVAVLSNAGARVGGFTTLLDLEAGTYPAYSGSMPNLLEQEHAYEPLQMGKVIYDGFDVTTGGFGDFYLDYATGDVLIFGEYSRQKSNGFNNMGVELDGIFLRRFSLDGQLRQKAQMPYSTALPKKELNDKAFTGNLIRQCRFNMEPLTGNYEFSVTRPTALAGTDIYTFAFSNALQPLGVTHHDLSKKELQSMYKQEIPLIFTNSLFALKRHGADHETRWMHQYTEKDPLVYTQLKQLKERAKINNFDYFLTATEGGKGLLFEHRESLGGHVNIYPF